jgi:UPF0755 protein
MKKWIVVGILFIIVGLSVLGFYINVEKTIIHPFLTKDKSLKLTVEQGDTLNGLINSLSNKNVIGNSYIIKWYIKNQGINTAIKPGTYDFDSGINLKQFVNDLNVGSFDESIVNVTIPEGYNLEQIADLLDKKKIISKDAFLLSCKEYNYPNYIKKDSKRKHGLEGFLFPDTYQFKQGMKGNDIITIMLLRFSAVINVVQATNNQKLSNEQIDKLIVMASIVEGEAQKDDERAKIASVFYNRLSIKMKLQSCATVEYALGKHISVLTQKDTLIQSPYNTYYVSALPVGPICNPGKKSIEAALDPSKTNYIYFVSKNDGSHFFTNNYKDFLAVKKTTQGF